MKNLLINLKTAFQAELIKKKGTGLFWVSIILGIISPLIFTIAVIVLDEKLNEKLPTNFYNSVLAENLNAFGYFFFTMLIIINASRIAQLDHRNGGWQLMETQPMYKFSIYFSKFLLLLMANLISILSFVISCFIFGGLFLLIKETPENAITTIDWNYALQLIYRLFVGSFFLTALQYALSVLIPSFIWSLLIGFFGFISNIILTGMNKVPDWSPFNILNKVAVYNEGSDIGNTLIYTEKLGFLIGLFIVIIGFVWYQNKSFKRSFFKNKMRTSISIISVLIFGLLLAWFMKPNQFKPNEKTIIAGEIETEKPFDKAFLIHPQIGDTLAIIPIKNKKYSQEIVAKIPLDKYKLVFGNSISIDVLMSSNDSIYSNIRYLNNELDFKNKGTRLAESIYQEKNSREWNFITYYLEENQLLNEPNKFFEDLYDVWEEKYNESNSFKTADNYVFKADFIDKIKKQICVEHLNYVNQFIEKRKAAFPNEKTILPENIKEIQAKIALDDETLISNDEYITYLSYELTKNDKREIASEIKQIEGIAKLKNSSFKNRLLFVNLKKMLEEASNSAERNELFATYSNQITDSNLQKSIAKYLNIYEQLGRGNVAKEIDVITLDQKPAKLSQLKGKYVIIDVWASWCGPCKYESPYFEKMALKFKNKNIAFIGLNIDKNKEKWFIDANVKSKSVNQWYVINQDQMSVDYNVEFIPRFIFIDANGKIINANMPKPSDKSFELILRKEMNLKDE